jgi:hypothetical protein
MHTGIRAARSMNIDTPSFDQGERTRQLTLNRPELALNLPAMKIGAVVLK